MGDASAAKAELRREMRTMRRALPDRPARSALIWDVVERIPPVAAASSIMVFRSVPGEPETESFVAWCRSRGKTVTYPEDDPPVEPRSIDVVVVPGLAFTPAGDRLGQGGGWYDRFLAQLPTGVTTIGVGFEPQLVTSLPTEPHDRRLDLVVTDAGHASV